MTVGGAIGATYAVVCSGLPNAVIAAPIAVTSVCVAIPVNTAATVRLLMEKLATSTLTTDVPFTVPAVRTAE